MSQETRTRILETVADALALASELLRTISDHPAETERTRARLAAIAAQIDHNAHSALVATYARGGTDPAQAIANASHTLAGARARARGVTDAAASSVRAAQNAQPDAQDPNNTNPERDTK